MSAETSPFPLPESILDVHLWMGEAMANGLVAKEIAPLFGYAEKTFKNHWSPAVYEAFGARKVSSGEGAVNRVAACMALSGAVTQATLAPPGGRLLFRSTVQDLPFAIERSGRKPLLIRRMPIADEEPIGPVTLRSEERAALHVASFGLGNDAMSEVLSISPKAVEGRLRGARYAFGVRRTAHAIAHAITRGLIDPNTVSPNYADIDFEVAHPRYFSRGRT